MKIYIDIKDSVGFLTGRNHGQEIYEEYIEPKLKSVNLLELISNEEKVEIFFCDNLKGASISFVQALISPLIVEIGKSNTLKLLELKSNDKELTERLYRALNF